MPLNTSFSGMPWLTQPADPIDSLAKGASAGSQIAGTMARRQGLKLQAQGMEQDERFRQIDSDIRRDQVNAMMDVRLAQAGAARAKLEQLGAYAASEKQGWDNVNSTMEQADEINKDDPEWLSVKRPKFFQDVLWNNRHLTYASRPEIPQRMEAAKMLNESRQGAIASREKMAAEKLVSQEKTTGQKIDSGERTWDMRLGSAEWIAAERLKAQEKTAANKDTRTTTQKNTQALVAAENAALIAGGNPPRNPAEETARTVELLTPKVTGSGKEARTADQKNLATAQELKNEFEAASPENKANAEWRFNAFTRMAHITDDPKQSTQEKLKAADALGQIRALRANDTLLNKPGASQPQIDAIIKQFSPGGETPKAAAPPAAQPKYFFKRGALGVEAVK